MSLAPLATADDIASRLGRDLTITEAIRAAVLLQDASALIRRHCRPNDFLPHVNETLPALRADGWSIKLPVPDATDVASVTAIGAPDLGLPDLAIPWFVFDGIDTVKIAPSTAIINLPEVWFTDPAYPGTFSVVASWGPAEIPDEVVSVCANAALGVLMAPTMATGVIGETIGPYSWRAERTGGGTVVALTQADLAILDDFRQTENTVKVMAPR